VDKQISNKNRTIRNLGIFVICTLGIPWLGWGLDMLGNINPHDQQKSLGWLFFLIAPLGTSLLLRAFAGDGWKDLGLKPAFKGNGKWYAFALLFHPLLNVLILVIGLGIGLTLIPDLSMSRLTLVGQAVLISAFPNFIKNIFEEFSWRGYLTPKIQSVVDRPLLGHLLTGMIWFGWHLPYYLVLLDPATVRGFTSLNMGLFLLTGLFGLMAAAIVYGEIRIRTNSVWPTVLMHLTGNIFLAAMIGQKFFSSVGVFGEVLASPGWSSMISILLFAATGVWFYRTRMGTAGAAG